jgi:hypothetical protein
MAGSILAVSKGYKSKLALLFRIADDDKQHQDRAVIRGIHSIHDTYELTIHLILLRGTYSSFYLFISCGSFYSDT